VIYRSIIPWVFLPRSLFFSQINIAAETAIGSSDYLLLYAASVRQRYGAGSMGRVPDVLVYRNVGRARKFYGGNICGIPSGNLT